MPVSLLVRERKMEAQDLQGNLFDEAHNDSPITGGSSASYPSKMVHLLHLGLYVVWRRQVWSKT